MGVPLAFKDDLAADALAMKRAEIALVTRVSRRERLGQAERSIGRWARIARTGSSAGQDRRQFLALRHDRLRLRATRHAAERIQILRDDEVYAVVAYILQLNGVIGENDTIDAQTLPAVRMPNRDGFVRFSRGK